MMNFEFLKGKKGFRMLAHFTSDAETFAVSHPDMSAISARKSLEWIVKTFYVKKYGKCREATLFDLIQDNRFSGYIDATTISCIHLVRQIGNNAAHGERIKKTEAIKDIGLVYLLRLQDCRLHILEITGSHKFNTLFHRHFHNSIHHSMNASCFFI